MSQGLSLSLNHGDVTASETRQGGSHHLPDETVSSYIGREILLRSLTLLSHTSEHCHRLLLDQSVIKEMRLLYHDLFWPTRIHPLGWGRNVSSLILSSLSPWKNLGLWQVEMRISLSACSAGKIKIGLSHISRCYWGELVEVFTSPFSSHVIFYRLIVEL